MKKSYLFFTLFYALIAVFAVAFTLLDSFSLSVSLIFSNWFLLAKVIFSLIFLTISLTMLLILLAFIVDDYRQKQLTKHLKAILANQQLLVYDDDDISLALQRVSGQMKRLTSKLQKTENAYMSDRQEIVKQERKRIARDLHDTVSQELFASSLILSGLSQNVEHLDREQLKAQLLTAEHILTDAQKDLRVLLLHLRPTELEGKTLSEGLAMILRELMDKSDIEVIYRESLGDLPKVIEENLFRIAQEFISNTLKHAQATCLEVYLFQHPHDVELKMIDNGKGFDMTVVRELSYGLTNIEERVDDLAGQMTFLSSPGQGVSMDIRLPLLTGDEDGED